MATFESEGSLPAVAPIFEADGIQVFADPRNASAIDSQSLESIIKSHTARCGRGDYFAINAYLERCAANDGPLQELRHEVRDAHNVATTLGYGPRFLHSTGQLHKGGPNRGVILQLTADDATDLAVPGASYTFGVLKTAQAQGDFDVLAERGRRVIRIHLGADVAAGLGQLAAAVKRALAS
jgi:transaldolase/glucose-6-phosphate isomerase